MKVVEVFDGYTEDGGALILRNMGSPGTEVITWAESRREDPSLPHLLDQVVGNLVQDGCGIVS